MKVLFSLDKYSASEGGADRVARGVARCLHAGGHEVRVLEPGEANARAGGPIPLLRRPLPGTGLLRDNDLKTLRWNLAWSDEIDEVLREFPADLVLTQNILAPASVAAARRAGARSCILFHGYRPLAPDFFRGRDALASPPASFWNVPWRQRLKWPLVCRVLELYEAAYHNADLVIANSDYTARVIQRFFSRAAPVCCPVLDLHPATENAGAPRPTPGHGGSVLFVKPQAIKGVATLLAVSRMMPRQRFVVAGIASRRLRRALARRPNLDYHGWVQQMGPLYRDAAVVFGPARIPEPFGRVFVEAALHGVPSVAARTGGIPEAVGPGGILLDMHAPPTAWRDALQQALEPARNADLGRAARDHATRLLEEHNPRRLLDLLETAGQ